MSKTAYIAGPMRGKQFYNCLAFSELAHKLMREGYAVINPHDLDLERGFDVGFLPADRWDWSQLPPGLKVEQLAKDIAGHIASCDELHLLEGWEESSGARMEKAMAEFMGKQIVRHESS